MPLASATNAVLVVSVLAVGVSTVGTGSTAGTTRSSISSKRRKSNRFRTYLRGWNAQERNIWESVRRAMGARLRVSRSY